MIHLNNKTYEKQVEYIAEHLKIELNSPIYIEEIHKPTLNGYEIHRIDQNHVLYYGKKHHFFAGIGHILKNLKEFEYQQKITWDVDRLGLMLDAARNAVPRVETLKQYIMTLVLLGYNYLEIYVEDVFEVVDEPMFGYMRGKYSIKEMQDLDVFADQFGMEIVPCIQTLAHLERIFQHPEYSEIHDIDDILLVGHQRTYDLIDHMLKTTSQTFMSRRINIGMDEAWRLGHGNYIHKFGYETKVDIMKKHLKAVIDLCHNYGYHASMWADMFFNLSGGNYHLDAIEISQEVIQMVPKHVTLIYWDYYRTDFEGYNRRMKQLRELTNDYAFAGGAWKWTGFAPMNHFTMKAMKPAIDACKMNGFKDFLLTAWGDNGAEAAQFSIIPSLLYIRDLSYQKEDRQSFAALLTGYTYDELLKLDLPDLLYHHDAYTPTNPSKYLLFEDVLMGHRQISVEKNYKTYYKQHAKILKPLSEKTSKYSYLFRTMHDLADLLSIKSTLSLEIYQAYHAKDSDQLKKLISRLKKVIKKTNVFYETFKTQWFYENKPFGFEIQTYRFGGLLLRLEEVQKILEAYVNGDLSHISELDERILTPKLNKQYNGTIYFNQFINYISYSKL